MLSGTFIDIIGGQGKAIHRACACAVMETIAGARQGDCDCVVGGTSGWRTVRP